MTIQCRADSDAIQGAAEQQYTAADPGHRAGLPDQPYQRPQALRLDGRTSEHFGFAEHAVDQGDRNCGDAGALQDEIAHLTDLHTVMYGYGARAGPVNTVVYGRMMRDQA